MRQYITNLTQFEFELITDALGDTGFYTCTANSLANGFTVVSYDGCCNSRGSGDRICLDCRKAIEKDNFIDVLEGGMDDQNEYHAWTRLTEH